jgi:hypothetical protein
MSAISRASRPSIPSAGRADGREALFTSTLIAAVELLESHSQARVNQTVLRLDLEGEIGSGTALTSFVATP